MKCLRAATGAVIVVAAAAALACGSGDRTSDSKGSSGKAAAAPAAQPSLRAGRTSWRPLLAEAPRAELDAGGLLVDLGSPDQFKYTRGDWRTGWGNGELDDDGVSFATVPGGNARLETDLRAPANAVVARVRSEVPDQRLSIVVDGARVRSTPIQREWTTVEVDLADKPIAPGRRRVELRFERPAKETRGEVDWVWLRSDANAPPVAPLPRVLPIHIGKQTRRALPAPTARTYSFYMQLPERASLVFDYGADEKVAFSVHATTDDEPTRELFSETAERGVWTEARVDLAAYAGKTVRLDMTTAGPPAMAGWGEPEIMLEGEQAPAPAAAATPPRNVVFILIDTVRADVFAPFNPGNQVHTPAYDALAEESTVFTRAYNNENWTKPSVATTLSGLYPTTHDTKKDGSVLPDEIEILPERLHEEGFATGGFVANGFVSDRFGFEQGFDTFTNYIRENKKSEAEYVYADALAWIDEHRESQRFFAYIQTIDPHVVYRVDTPYSKRYYPGKYDGPLGSSVSGEEQADISKGRLKATDDDISWIKALYWGEVSYHDEHFGNFIEALRERGLLDDTLIVVTNDHGEELYEHGRLGHGHSLYEELLHAPLLAHYPPVFAAGKRVDDIVEQVDLSPTVLEVLDLRPLGDADGVSLLPLVRGEPVQRPTYAISEFLESRRSLRVGRWKFERSSGDSIKLYDLVADPGEQTNLVDERPIARRLCDVMLGEGLANTDKAQRLERVAPKRRFQAGEAKIDNELRKQLEALGYFGG